MIPDAVPNLATDWKARVGVAVLALAIGLMVALVTGSLGVSGIVMGTTVILINAVRYWQERAARAQASQGHAADSN
jgi:hypothetical protein